MVRITASAAAILLASSLLAGCVQHHPPPAPKPARPVELPPLPKTKPASHPHPAPARARGPDVNLVGLDRTDLEALLGPPASKVEQGASQSWTYRGKHCTVEVTLFFDVSRNDFYVLDRKVDRTNGSEKAAQRCLKQIRDVHEKVAKASDAGKAPGPEKAGNEDEAKGSEPAK